MTVSTQTEDHIDDQVDTVLQASRSLIRVVDHSLAEVDGILGRA